MELKPRGAVEWASPTPVTTSGTPVRVYVTTGRVCVSMEKKEAEASEWLLRVRVTEP